MEQFNKEELHFIDHYLYLAMGLLLMELKEGKSLFAPGELHNRPLRDDEITLVKYEIVYLNKLLKEKFNHSYPNFEDWVKECDIDVESILKQIEIDKQKNLETFNKEF